MAYDIYYPATVFVAVYLSASYQCSLRAWYQKKAPYRSNSWWEAARARLLAFVQLNTLMAGHMRNHILLEHFRVCSTEPLLVLDSTCQQNSNNIGMGHA